MRHIHRSVGTSALLAVVFVLALGAVGVAGASTTDTAAGNATVSLDPADRTVDPGEQAAYDIIVDGADGQVSAYKMTVALGNTSVATVSEYEHAQSPSFDNTQVYDDRVELSAAMGDNYIDATDKAVLGTVTVAGESDGVSEITFADGASGVELTDENDTYYDVTGVSGGTLTVEQPEVDIGLSPANQTVGVGGDVAYDVVVEGATDGIAAYQGNITLTDPSVATVESYEHTYQPDFDDTEVFESGVSLSAAMGDNTIDGAEETVLGTVTLSGQANGTTAVEFGDELEVGIDNQAVSSYEIGTVTDGTLGVFEQYQEAGVELVPQGGVSVGETTLGVYVTGAESGVGAYSLEFALNSSQASFTGHELLAEGSNGPLDDSEITDGGSGFSLTAALLDATHDPAEEIHVANLDIEMSEPGEVTVESLGGEVADQNDTQYVLTTSDITLSVGEVPPVEGDIPPQDTNGNGLYGDVDGDGSMSIFDVQTLFDNLDDPVVQSNTEHFDFDDSGDGNVNIFDVQGLFDRL